MRGDELAPNPKNWREHGPEQTQALGAVLKEIGQAAELLAYWSARNGGRLTLINGHKRAKDFPAEFWDVAITDLDDAEADRLLAVLDPIGAMAQTDPAKLGALVEDLDAETAELQALLDQISSEAEDVTFKPFDMTEGEGEGEGVGAGDGAEGKPGRYKDRPARFKVRPVLDVDQVRIFEEALMATDKMSRGEALTEICQVFLDSKKTR